MKIDNTLFQRKPICPIIAMGKFSGALGCKAIRKSLSEPVKPWEFHYLESGNLM